MYIGNYLISAILNLDNECFYKSIRRSMFIILDKVGLVFRWTYAVLDGDVTFVGLT
jgi:hypothetical protein